MPVIGGDRLCVEVLITQRQRRGVAGASDTRTALCRLHVRLVPPTGEGLERFLAGLSGSGIAHDPAGSSVMTLRLSSQPIRVPAAAPFPQSHRFAGQMSPVREVDAGARCQVSPQDDRRRTRGGRHAEIGISATGSSARFSPAQPSATTPGSCPRGSAQLRMLAGRRIRAESPVLRRSGCHCTLSCRRCRTTCCWRGFAGCSAAASNAR